MHTYIPSLDSKAPAIQARQVNTSNKNTPSMHNPQRQNVTECGFKKKITYTKIPPEMVIHRAVAGNTEEEEEMTERQLRCCK